MHSRVKVDLYNFPESNMFCVKQYCSFNRETNPRDIGKIKLNYFQNREPYRNQLEYWYDPYQG